MGFVNTNWSVRSRPWIGFMNRAEVCAAGPGGLCEHELKYAQQDLDGLCEHELKYAQQDLDGLCEHGLKYAQQLGPGEIAEHGLKCAQQALEGPVNTGWSVRSSYRPWWDRWTRTEVCAAGPGRPSERGLKCAQQALVGPVNTDWNVRSRPWWAGWTRSEVCAVTRPYWDRWTRTEVYAAGPSGPGEHGLKCAQQALVGPVNTFRLYGLLCPYTK